MPHIIQTPEELTPEWLSDTLRKAGVLSPDTRVSSFTLDSDFSTVGILSHIVRVRPEYDGVDKNLPGSFVMKFPSLNPVYRDMSKSYSFYLREVNYYNLVAPDSKLISPKIYFAEYDPDDITRFTILMEEIMGKPGEQLKGATEDQIFKAVSYLAAHHKIFWNKTEKGAYNWLPSLKSPNIIGLNQHLYTMGLDLSLASYPELYDDFSGSRDMATLLKDRLFGLSEDLASGPQTIIHGDFKLDNLFFGDGQRSPDLAVIDYQITYKGPGPYDVAYLMTQSVDPQLRKRIDMDVIKRYHELIKAYDITDYDFDDCVRDYKKSAVYCFVYPVIASLGVNPKAEDPVGVGTYNLVKIMHERCLHAIFDLNLIDFM